MANKNLVLAIWMCSSIHVMAKGKSHLDYWESRIFNLKTKREDGGEYVSPEYYVRLVMDGKRVRFCLDSSNKKKASKKAREIWDYYLLNGSDETITTYKKKSFQNNELTVGEFLKAIDDAKLIAPKTFTTYKRKLYQVVAGVKGFKGTKQRFNYYGDGAKQWRDRMESVKLADLSASEIVKWRAKYVAERSETPMRRKQAQTTVSSILRNSKTLFSQKYLSQIDVALDHDPFEGIVIGSSTTRRYHSTIDFKSLAETSREELYVEIPKIAGITRELAVSRVQQFKILLLALGCGLRRGEIDMLRWESVLVESSQIILEESEFGSLKSETSSRVIDVDPEVMKLFGKWKESERGKYVIFSRVRPRPNSTYHHYRCDRHFKRLVAWLKQHGITRNNALHELRKEYGSRVCQEFGVYAASSALGHSNIRITAASYLEKKGRTAVSVF